MHGMEISVKNSFELINKGRQDCYDLHSWGPGIRPCYIIHYIVKGAGFLEVNGKIYEVKKGECFITYPYSVFYYYPDKKNPWEYIWVDFEGAGVDEYLDACILNYKTPVCLSQKTRTLKKYFETIEKLDIHGRNKLEAKGLLYSILGILYDENTLNTDSELIDICVALIHSNYHKVDFQTNNICKELGISVSTLYRLFIKNFNTSPNEYLIEYRINQAKPMLKNGAMVKTVSLSCGYEDPLYFSRLFKEKTGFTPQKFSTLK